MMGGIPGDAPAWVAAALLTARVARLGTVDAEGDVRLVPVCFAVDHKPKRTGQLRRLDDVRASSRATLLVDHYDDDWTRLWWVRVRGRAAVVPPGETLAAETRAALAAKYGQYRERPPEGQVLAVEMDELRWWRWAGS
jgi:PPOX class probable F420-dependent enzyme